MDISAIERMSNDEAFAELCRLRWGEGGEQTCPRCGFARNHYKIGTRKQWRCKDCGHTFSVTSGTIFSFHKLPFHKILRTIAELAKRPRGISASELSVTIDCEYKAAWAFLQKIREGLWVKRDVTPLEGTVHMDGAYVCYHVRPQNRHSNRVDRRLKQNQNPNKRCIFVMRQLVNREEHAKGMRGATRSIVSIIKSENQKDVMALCSRYVRRGSEICCDENSAYDPLHAHYKVHRINHQVEYATRDGFSNNQAESMHARLRGMLKGVVHHFWAKHAFLYANQIAYYEDTRRWDTRRIYEDIAHKCLGSPPSRDFGGYWQGNHCDEERLAV